MAKIITKYMNGYQTFGKILKCKVLPSEPVNSKLFRGRDIRPDNCPRFNVHKRATRKFNKTHKEKQIQRRFARLTSTCTKKPKKLEVLGVYIPLQGLIGIPLQQGEKEGEEDETNLNNDQGISKDIP